LLGKQNSGPWTIYNRYRFTSNHGLKHRFRQLQLPYIYLSEGKTVSCAKRFYFVLINSIQIEKRDEIDRCGADGDDS
jgi:hypothetical protein